MSKSLKVALRALTDGNPDEALAVLCKAIDKDPQNYALLDARCATYIALNRRKDALKDARDMVKIARDNPKGYLRAARLYRDFKQYEIAIKVFNAALSKTEDSAAKDRLSKDIEACQSALEAVKRANTAFVHYLPIEIILSIIRYLPASDQLRCTRVCKAWKNSIYDDPSCWQTFIVRSSTKRLHRQAEFYNQRLQNTSKGIRRLVFSEKDALKNYKHFDTLQLPKKIQELYVSNCNLDFSYCFMLLSHTLQVVHLTVPNDAARFIALHLITLLNLAPQLHSLTAISEGQRVDLQLWADEVSEESVSSVQEMHFDNVEIESVVNISEDWNPFPHLRRLTLRMCHWPDLVTSIKGSKTLQHLKMQDSTNLSTDLNFTNILSLDIQNQHVLPIANGHDASHSYANLQMVRLCAVHLTPGQLGHLSLGSPLLTSLIIDRIRGLEGGDLPKALPRWPLLETLGLSNTLGVNNEAIETLITSNPLLRFLTLAKCETITGGPLVRLVRSRLERAQSEHELKDTVIEQMVLDGCRSIDVTALQWLKANVGRVSATMWEKKEKVWKTLREQ